MKFEQAMIALSQGMCDAIRPVYWTDKRQWIELFEDKELIICSDKFGTMPFVLTPHDAITADWEVVSRIPEHSVEVTKYFVVNVLNQTAKHTVYPCPKAAYERILELRKTDPNALYAVVEMNGAYLVPATLEYCNDPEKILS